MASSVPTKVKRQMQLMRAIGDIISDDDAWSITGEYATQACKLLVALGELEKSQAPFELVDAALPWSYKAERLMAWLRSHPDFTCKAIELTDALPASKGSRGVIAKEAISAEEPVFKVPQACMLSTATAIRSPQLGELLREPAVHIRDMPTVVLLLHLMVEHARCHLAPASDAVPATADAAASATVTIPVPVAPLGPLPKGAKYPGSRGRGGHGHSHGAGEECHSDEEEEDEDCGDAAHGTHGHSHGGGGGGSHGHSHGGGAAAGAAAAGGAHGHSHGGKPCHGHGHGAAPAPAAASSHGHSHGGKPCHGHGHGGGGHAAGPKPPKAQPLDAKSHPWGSAFRAYIALLPAAPGSCLYFSVDQMNRLQGLEIQHEVASFIRNATMTYIRMYSLVGAGSVQLLGAPFAEHFTWAHFKWAMSCAMSRQNRVPIPQDDEHALALVPLYDLVNHAPGRITSFFFGEEQILVLDAAKAFAPGDEVTMSYGARSCHQMLQFQGFVHETPTPEVDHALVEAAMTGLADDPLFKIRVNVLSNLYVTPEHNAQRYLRAPSVQAAMQEAQSVASRAASLTGGSGSASVAASTAALVAKEMALRFEKIKWGQPFTFRVEADGTPSFDLLTFARVASIQSKPEAAEALKQCDATRKSILAAREAKRAAQMEKARKRLEARKARGAAGAAAKDADADGADSSSDDDHDDDDDDEEIVLALSKLSPENEVNAQETLVNVLKYAIGIVEEPTPVEGEAAAATATAKGASAAAGAAAAATGGAGTVALATSSGSGGYDPVTAYRNVQVGILKRALAKAEAALKAAQEAAPKVEAAAAAAAAAATPAPATLA